MKNVAYILVLLLVLALNANGQDLHFSQFYNSPLTANPANTGFIPEGDYRVGFNYRKQWSSIMTLPYKTMSGFADAKILSDKLENGWVGIGALVMGDVAGTGSLRSTKAYASVAYHQLLDLSSLLSAGFNIGYASKSIDVAKLKFPDQFDGHFFDATLPTIAILDRTKLSYFDLQAGINYTYFPSDNVFVNIGYSAHHINKPKESFFKHTDQNSVVQPRHIFQTNAMLKTSDNVILVPNLYYTNQAKASELVAGGLGYVNLANNGEKQFFIGGYYRFGDAAIGVGGVVVNNVKITYSYDATTSSLKNYNQSKGASEISVIKTGFLPQKQETISCPRF